MKNFLPTVSCHPLVSKLLVTASVLGLALAATPAEAATFFVDYTGIVTSGFDAEGLFGNIGTGLRGQNFTAHYLFDTSLGSRSTGPEEDDVQGYLESSPSLGATLTIGNRTMELNGAWYGEDHTDSVQRYDNLGGIGETPNGPFKTALSNLVYFTNSSPFPRSLDTAFSIDISNYSEFQNYGSFTYDSGTTANFLNLIISGAPVTIAGPVPITAVPEATTWATMLIGFGAIGFAMRRGKAKITVSYA